MANIHIFLQIEHIYGNPFIYLYILYMRVCVGESGAQFEAEAREGRGRMRGFCVAVV